MPERPTFGGDADILTPVLPDAAVADPPAGDARHTPARPSRTGRFTWVLRPIAIYLVSRVVTLAAFAVATTASHLSISGEINEWDSRWFIRAAEFGWPSHLPHAHGHVAGNTIAFFPVFPLLVRWLTHLTGFSLLTSGVIVTTVTGMTAMIGVWLLVRHYADRSAADRATLLLAMFPGSFVLSMVYSEGLAITCVAFGILALLNRRWVVAGLLGMVATGVTPIALAFEFSCLWCAYHAIVERRNWRALTAPVLAPLGFIAYQLWLWYHTGDLLAWRLTERGGWNSYPSIAYPVHLITTFVRDPIATTQQGDLLFVGIVVTVVCAIVAIRSPMPKAMLMYGLGAAILALVAAPVGLRPRFIFLAFPLVVAVGVRLRGRAYGSVLGLSIILMGLLAGYEVSTYWIFP